jgi:SM-20-related protein
MTTTDVLTRFDLFLLNSFFDQQMCAEIVAELRDAQDSPAAVYGRGGSGSIDERMRKAARLRPSQATFEFARGRLLECKGEVERHFRIKLGECEEPQFLRYRVGDFFVAHQDGNTGLLRLEQEQRKVSVVIFLSEQSEEPEPDAYCGGALVFSDLRLAPERNKFPLHASAGTLVAFRAETTHEVMPVTHGERYSIACWYR